MADAPGPTISLRPGGGRRNNPFAAFSQGAGVKAAIPQKVTPFGLCAGISSSLRAAFQNSLGFAETNSA